jgi:DNA-binding MurR/RpiR family transcriptional regulator
MGGTSTIASSELQHRLVRLGRPIAAYHDPVLMRVAGAALGAGHVLVVLSLTGITPELLDATRLAKSYGARVIAITPETSPLSALSDVTLPLVVAETDFIYKPTAARYGMLLAIDLLATELALFVPEDNKERLRRVKLALDAYRQGGERLPLGD